MTHFDLAIIGTGSGNSIIDDRFASQRVAILEKGTFGGTCLNVGCIPTKMFVYPADLALAASDSGPGLGLDTSFAGARWSEIRDRIFGRIDPIATGGRAWRIDGSPNVTVFEGECRFSGERRIDTGSGETITADQVVVAAGSRVDVPPIPGLPDVGWNGVHTSDTVMRLEELPPRLVIVGGGFVAAEFAHVFSALGTEVTVVNRGPGLLRQEDDEISARFTELARARWSLRLSTTVSEVQTGPGGLSLRLSDGTTTEADVVLLATGRIPNSDLLDMKLAGVDVDEAGVITVDEHQRTTAPGVWALGDIASEHQLKHVANHEARVVQHNLLHPDALQRADHRFVPHAVFSHPQVASVGLTERDAVLHGIAHVVAHQQYADIAYGWAMEDTSGFAKVLADPVTGQLLGAHIIGYQASILIQPLIQAMSFGQSADDVARGQYWIHPALTELVENVLLQLRVV